MTIEVCETTISEDEASAPPPGILGRDIYPGYLLPLSVHAGNSLLMADATHPRFAIVHVQQGSCLLAHGGEPIIVTAPAVLLLDEQSRPAVLRAAGLVLETTYFHPNIVNSAFFSPQVLKDTEWFEGTTNQDAYLLRLFLDVARVGKPLPLPPMAQKQLASSFARIAEEGRAQRNGDWPCRARSWLIELLFHLRVLAESAPADHMPAASGSRLDQALLVVHDRYNTSITLDELARLCGSNRTTLNTHFRTVTGQSVRAYIIGLRMQMAATLLRDTLLPITEIMSRVGYDNPSNFTRTFRSATGKTPRDYRDAESWLL
ncbi:Regulatory protein SoxS [Andreprevotia sp. IGB-42]|uniref:helix-turn-helix domain-containing protein n=1 Tax=Andreprevotia sp. IGB-42 TaxID=2497473 RepID=UPI001358A931|nr:AraC family transcriptional regulator [Andreprevotia sp. IGB-42]KAF0815242.1 Regulatory protein SoxS [Andreprevotia sp. IGB-42]